MADLNPRTVLPPSGSPAVSSPPASPPVLQQPARSGYVYACWDCKLPVAVEDVIWQDRIIGDSPRLLFGSDPIRSNCPICPVCYKKANPPLLVLLQIIAFACGLAGIVYVVYLIAKARFG